MSVVDEIENATLKELHNFRSPNVLILSKSKYEDLKQQCTFKGHFNMINTLAGPLRLIVSESDTVDVKVCQDELVFFLEKLEVIK